MSQIDVCKHWNTIPVQNHVAVAAIVHGVVITSSPGSIPIAPMAAINPDVHELTAIVFDIKVFRSFSIDYPWTAHEAWSRRADIS